MTGKVSYIYNEDGSPPNVKFHCDDCGMVTKGFSLCLKCNPQTYKIINIDKALAPSEFEIAIWNEAIDECLQVIKNSTRPYYDQIRKLKK